MVVSPFGEANKPISCTVVNTTIEPCRTYLVLGLRPTTTCCSGVRALSILATPRLQRSQVCECLKAFAASANVNATNAANLPGLC
ncbi:hypothetical protein Ancab_031409, partial [Ancistrocladus abbreviatus]